ncbi:hypothetical protein YB2330_003237 [Saitoella coloradoensis]
MPLVTINTSIIESLKKAGVIPDVLDPFDATAMVNVTYGNKDVALGNKLSVDETQKQPDLRIIPEGEDDATYSLILTDPDAPSREDPKWAQYIHWGVSGVKFGNIESFAANAAESGELGPIDFSGFKTIKPYEGPAPPEKTGFHRYCFILLREPASGKVPELPKERKQWDGVREWAKKGGLEPVGANFFYCQNDKQ